MPISKRKVGRPKTLNLTPGKPIQFDVDIAKRIEKEAADFNIGFAAVVRLIAQEYYLNKEEKAQ